MDLKVAEDLRTSFGGESQAHMRYKIWGDKAEKEGFPTVAKMYEAISFAEGVHAQSHFNVMKSISGDFEVTAMGGFGVGSTKENLEASAGGENWEVETMYPEFIKRAEEAGEKAAVISMNYAMEAEKAHEKFFNEAKEAVNEGKDPGFENIFTCPGCGYAAHGEVPDKCPVCGNLKENFKYF